MAHEYINSEALEESLLAAAEIDRIHWINTEGGKILQTRQQAEAYRKKWIDFNRMFFVRFLDHYLHTTANQTKGS